MYNLLIVSHGTLAEHLIKTVEMILGKGEGIESLCLQAGETKENFEKIVETKLDSLQGREVLVLADLFGGTPFNSTITSVLKGRKNINILTGVNLPMVIQAVLSKDSDINEVIDEIKNSGIEGIQNGIEILNNSGDE